MFGDEGNAQVIVHVHDVSTGPVRRFRVEMVAPPDAPREVLTALLPISFQSIRERSRAEVPQGRHSSWLKTTGKQPAQVIFGFVYESEEDRQAGGKWIARVQWIDPTVPKDLRPIEWGGELIDDDIVVDWAQPAL